MSRTTLLLWGLAAAWLPAGFIFRYGIKDFGWGFLPFVAWMYSFGFIALAAGIAFVVNQVRGGASARRRALVWLVFAIAYAIAAVAWHGSEFVREWVITHH